MSASVVNTAHDVLTLVASRGSAEVAGDDIDAELAAAAYDRADRQTRELMRQACESMKRELSKSSMVKREVKLPAARPRR